MDDIVKEARDAIQLSYDFDRENRNEAIEDMRFRANFQWSDAAKAERVGRPCITINRTDQFIHQVVNPIRENMPAIKVEPDGDDQSDMAEIYDGLFNRIQYNSSASHVYANAVEHMATCGIGWFRVATDYTSDKSFDQEIMIKRVFNPLSVYPDPSSLEPDRSDMNWCVVSEMWPVEAFKKKWKGKAATGMDTPTSGTMATGFAWGTSDSVRVAEYWRRKETTKKLVQLSNGEAVDMALVEKFAPQYADQIKPHIVNERTVKAWTTEMVLVSGAEQLEEPYTCPCKWIPIIPVIGAEIPLETGTYRYGLLRFQREPQQLSNYFMSVAAETLAQQPKAPFVAPFDAIKSYKNIWDNHNIKPTPYLPYDPQPALPNGGRPERVDPPPLPQGLIAMAQLLSEDMKAATGQYDPSLGNKSSATSGVAIGRQQQQGDNATYHFTDNLEHGLEHLGRILLDMIPQVYDTERTLRIRAADDTEKTVTVNKSLGGYDGQEMMHNDLSKASFSNVRVVLGPSFQSRRQEAQQQLTALIQAVPEIAQVGGDIIVRQFDFDGAEELADRLKKAVPQQLLGEEANGGQPPPPDPMAQMAQQAQGQMLQSQVQGAEEETAQARAKTAQEAEKVNQEQHRTQGVMLDNQLKLKKLREPPPQRSAGRQDKE